MEDGIWQIEREVGNALAFGMSLLLCSHHADVSRTLDICLELQWVVSHLSAMKEDVWLTGMKIDDEEW